MGFVTRCPRLWWFLEELQLRGCDFKNCTDCGFVKVCRNVKKYYEKLLTSRVILCWKKMKILLNSAVYHFTNINITELQIEVEMGPSKNGFGDSKECGRIIMKMTSLTIVLKDKKKQERLEKRCNCQEITNEQSWNKVKRQED